MRAILATAALAGLLTSAPAHANWTAATDDVATATHDPRIAAALAAVNAIDDTVIKDDHAAFATLLADDLAVNNPQNGVSVMGMTARRDAAGRISYSHYRRVIEYAGRRGDMVLLMGEEIVVPRTPAAAAPGEIHRRFTDLWKQAGGRWVLTARQATIIARP